MKLIAEPETGHALVEDALLIFVLLGVFLYLIFNG